MARTVADGGNTRDGGRMCGRRSGSGDGDECSAVERKLATAEGVRRGVDWCSVRASTVVGFGWEGVL
ncbi:hypothetical protein RYX36_013726 [Vicia faba]